jgi:membrane protein
MTLTEQLKEVWRLGGLEVSDLARRVYARINAHDVWGYAAQLAYYFLFSLFPFLLFLAALLAYIPIPDLMDQMMELIGQFAPKTALDIMEEILAELLTRPRSSLLSIGILLALWSASSAIAAVSSSLNHAYGVREGRPFWKSRGTAILLTMALAVLLISSMLLLIFGPEIGGWLADRLGVGRAFDLFWLLVRWPVVLLLMTFAIALVYYFTPDVEQEWRWITPGAVFAVLAWVAMSLLFAYYANNFGQYDKTYGSIGAVIVLLTWMYLSGFVLLIGGEINAEIEHASVTGKEPGEKELSSDEPAGRPARAR